MKALLPLFVAAFVLAAPPAPTIEKLDPALDALVAAGAKIEKVGTGYGWAEGPIWCKDRFVFSDVPKNIAYVWKRGDAEPAVQQARLVSVAQIRGGECGRGGVHRDGSSGTAAETDRRRARRAMSRPSSAVTSSATEALA